MEATTLWHVLVMDWSAVENTPPTSRKPLELQRWHFRVERLAQMLERPQSELVSELKDEAKMIARHQRRKLEASLAEDLAVSRAQGQRVKPPWLRKLRALAEVSGQSSEDLRRRIVDAAKSIQVVEAR